MSREPIDSSLWTGRVAKPMREVIFMSYRVRNIEPKGLWLWDDNWSPIKVEMTGIWK